MYPLLLTLPLLALVVSASSAQDSTLFAAARDGDLVTLRRVLDGGGDPNVADAGGWTPLMVAAMNGRADAVGLLLERGADPDFGEADQGPPLAVAAMTPVVSATDETAVVRRMLDGGAGVDVPNGAGMTPLMYAAREGNVGRAALLVARGANVNHRDARRWTPLRFAASAGSAPIVELLVAGGANPDVLDESGRTPLHYAASAGGVDVARALLDAGADPNGGSVTVAGATPLGIAAARNDTALIVLLLKRGASANYSDRGDNVDRTPRTPLDWARHHRNRVAERALLGAGALTSVDLAKLYRVGLKAIRRGIDRSATRLIARRIDPRVSFEEKGEEVDLLSEAVEAGRVAVVEAILASRYAPDVRTLLAKYRHADDEGHDEIARLILRHSPGPIAMLAAAERDDDLFKAALDLSGGAIDYTDENGRTLLHEAAQAGSERIVAMLLERGANVSVKGDWKETALFDAVRSGNADIVRMLIERNVDITARNIRGMTPLHAAARVGHAEIVDILARAGADVDAADARGWRPLHQAAWANSEATIRALMELGATRDARDKHRQAPVDIARDMKNDDAVEELLN